MAMRAPRVELPSCRCTSCPSARANPPPTVIFVEDVGRMRAQAQQMKLVALGRLTASIAHEIRNPLSSIGHAADLIAEGGSVDPKADERLLAIIRDNVFRLDRMVQEVLYLNRRDRAQPEPIDPAPWLANFVRQFCDTEKVPADAIDVQVRTTQRMVFDRQHLDQVLWNLVAQRVAPRAQEAGVGAHRARAERDAGPAHASTCTTTGRAWRREAKPHLFEPFFTTDAQGTGLGLYIARELCEGNGARIEYVEGPDGGHFRVTMKGA